MCRLSSRRGSPCGRSCIAAERIARSLDRLDAGGRLLLTPFPLADTVYKKQYRHLYESLDYIRRDSAAFARFGVKDLDDLAAIFPEGVRDYVSGAMIGVVSIHVSIPISLNWRHPLMSGSR